MKIILLIILFLVISGEVYSQKVAVRGFGDKKIYVTDSYLDADMLVYVTTDEWKVKPGVWYYVDSYTDAEWIIRFVKSKDEADLIIKYVSYLFDAGWTDKGRKKSGSY